MQMKHLSQFVNARQPRRVVVYLTQNLRWGDMLRQRRYERR